jgi:predicted Zn-dependent protease
MAASVTIHGFVHRCRRTRRLVAAALFALPFLLPASAPAHPFVDDRLALLDAQIAAEPADYRLRLSRGSLLLDEHRAHAALVDFERALELDSALNVAHLLTSRALLADGQPEPAVAAARRYLTLEPDSARGWRALARALDARSQASGVMPPAEAVAAFERSVALAPDPSPDDYLECAALERRGGQIEPALRSLEAGVARLGPLTALLSAALEIERERGAWADALSYAERLAATSPQGERWQLERAHLLRQLGRDDEARVALDQAKATLAGRSAARRASPVFAALAREIESARQEIDSASGSPSATGGAR